MTTQRSQRQQTKQNKTAARKTTCVFLFVFYACFMVVFLGRNHNKTKRNHIKYNQKRAQCFKEDNVCCFWSIYVFSLGKTKSKTTQYITQKTKRTHICNNRETSTMQQGRQCVCVCVAFVLFLLFLGKNRNKTKNQNKTKRTHIKHNPKTSLFCFVVSICCFCNRGWLLRFS